MKFAEITHTGTVVAQSSGNVFVELDHISKSECGGCAMSAVCGKGGDAVTVEAVQTEGVPVSVGMKVRIVSSVSRTKANILLLGLPLCAFVGGAAIATAVGMSEAGALFAAVLACLLCFLVVRLCGSKNPPLWKITGISD